MANIILKLNGTIDSALESSDPLERISTGSRVDVLVSGKKSTYCIVRKNKDVIAAIGYVCHVDSDSTEAALLDILNSFNETQIGNIKKVLIGQYILLIKKNKSIFVFSDFMGVRNIFYSDDGMIITSSYSQAENLLQTSPADLDINKVFEFLAMRHILYPTWLGQFTGHKHIKWLLPYEYIVINTENPGFRLGSIVYFINNRKQTDYFQLSNELLNTLKSIIGRNEYKNSVVAASLTGGRDSRLVAAIAAGQYPNIHYRTAVSLQKYNSVRDLKVAKKVARVSGIPLDIYQFQPGRDEERFRQITEGFVPTYNHSITPLIDNSATYSLGFGGAFGTELFVPIPWSSIDEYIKAGIERANKFLHAEEDFWTSFRESLYSQFRKTKEHYRLIDDDDRDYIRLFNLLDTARYSSFILSAFNNEGYHLEPYGNYAVLDLALRVAPKLWGNHRKLGGNALIQKVAMSALSPRLARIFTYSTLRPMLPFSVTSLPLYMLGFTLQAANSLRGKFVNAKKGLITSNLPGGYYASDGWEKQFVDRTNKIYGLEFNTSIVKVLKK